MDDENRVLILGGGGFLGSHLVDRLLEKEWRVRVYSRTLPGLLNRESLLNPGLELVCGQLEDVPRLSGVLEGCRYCIHLSSSTLPQASNRDPRADVCANLLPTLSLLERVRDSTITRMIFVSSGGTVYGPPQQVPIPEDHPTEPICSYGITKRAIEQYLSLEERLHGLDQRVVRLSNPYGERQRHDTGQGVVAVFLRKVIREELIEIWGDGSAIRDFVYAGDVADAIMKLLHYNGKEKIFNVGSGHGRSILEVLEVVEQFVGAPARVQFTPARSFDVSSNVLSIARARRELQWEPRISLEEGVARMGRYLQGNSN